MEKIDTLRVMGKRASSPSIVRDNPMVDIGGELAGFLIDYRGRYPNMLIPWPHVIDVTVEMEAPTFFYETALILLICYGTLGFGTLIFNAPPFAHIHVKFWDEPYQKESILCLKVGLWEQHRAKTIVRSIWDQRANYLNQVRTAMTPWHF